MEKLREFFDSLPGKITAAALIVVCAALTWWAVRPRDVAADLSRHRTYICSETGKPFDITLEEGMTIPVKSPHTGRKTGYPAEMCYWTKEGQPAKEPHAVLLKKTVDPSAGPTFCPVCGRLVVGHNPTPLERPTPPPTEQEYMAKRSRGGAGSEHSMAR
jgi:hypothetical protein